MSYTVERFTRVYCDDDGSFIEIRPDRDGLNCVCLLWVEDGEERQRVIFPPEQAKLVAMNMHKLAEQL